MALVGSVPRFAAFEAKVIIKAPLSFLRDEFFDANGVNVHSIGISFLLTMVVVVSVVLEGEDWVASSLHDFVSSFPDLLEVKSLLVPFFHGALIGYWTDQFFGLNNHICTICCLSF